MDHPQQKTNNNANVNVIFIKNCIICEVARFADRKNMLHYIVHKKRASND